MRRAITIGALTAVLLWPIVALANPVVLVWGVLALAASGATYDTVDAIEHGPFVTADVACGRKVDYIDRCEHGQLPFIKPQRGTVYHPPAVTVWDSPEQQAYYTIR